MTTKQISATEAARSFSDVISQVRYKGTEFDIVRGKEVVARIVPAGPEGGVPLDELNALIAALPRLDARDRDVFVQDIERGLARMRADVTEWD